MNPYNFQTSHPFRIHRLMLEEFDALEIDPWNPVADQDPERAEFVRTLREIQWTSRAISRTVTFSPMASTYLAYSMDSWMDVWEDTAKEGPRQRAILRQAKTLWKAVKDAFHAEQKLAQNI